MTISLMASATIGLLTAVAPNWAAFLALRALLGLTLSGLPAVGMTYLGEEGHPESIGLGMGLYIGGNAAGGLSGRLIAGLVSDFFGWRVGLGMVGIIGLFAAWMFVLELCGLGLTMMSALWVIVAGIATITFGFFGGHSTVSSWLGRRAGPAKAQASSLYLFGYYMGASVAGALGGLFYEDYGWNGVAAFVAGLIGFGLIFAWRLYYVTPLGVPQSPAIEAPLP